MNTEVYRYQASFDYDNSNEYKIMFRGKEMKFERDAPIEFTSPTNLPLEEAIKVFDGTIYKIKEFKLIVNE